MSLIFVEDRAYISSIRLSLEYDCSTKDPYITGEMEMVQHIAASFITNEEKNNLLQCTCKSHCLEHTKIRLYPTWTIKLVFVPFPLSTQI